MNIITFCENVVAPFMNILDFVLKIMKEFLWISRDFENIVEVTLYIF